MLVRRYMMHFCTLAMSCFVGGMLCLLPGRIERLTVEHRRKPDPTCIIYTFQQPVCIRLFAICLYALARCALAFGAMGGECVAQTAFETGRDEKAIVK